MRVLDIDLDFFLDGVVHHPHGNTRADALTPWNPDEVREFLEKGCGLSHEAKLVARLVETHDGVFDIWRKQICDGVLCAPFEVVHVDAHPDLGLGSASHVRILTQLVHLNPADRQHPERGGWQGLTEANYLAFAVACRWISAIEYVHHPEGGGDVPQVYFRNHDFRSGVIEPPRLPAGTKSFRRLPESIQFEPPVQYTEFSRGDYCESVGFDFGYLCKSPRYTPQASDALIPIFAEYLEFIS